MVSFKHALIFPALALALTGCQDALDSVANKVEHPLPIKIRNKMKAYDMSSRSPIMMRVFKEENVLEVWKAKSTGKFLKIAEYEICKWSGELGPKFKEGDRQAPEGYYLVRPHQMNPNSSYYLSFNLGYPNTYDRAHNRTGSHLMVHGACSSAGCYSMTDEQVLEIYAFARDAFRGGQDGFYFAAYPFRPTAENMARYRDHKYYDFWKMLKVGYDHFELTKRPPKVDVCDRKYVFNQNAVEGERFNSRASCPATTMSPNLELAYSSYVKEYQKAYEAEIRKLERRNNPPAISSALSSLTAPVQVQPAAQETAVVRNAATAPAVTVAELNASIVPVPQNNPAAPQGPEVPADKPFWKIWSR